MIILPLLNNKSFLKIYICLFVKSTFHDKKSNQNYVTKKVLLHFLFDNLPSFFSKTANGCFYFNSKTAQFL